MPDTLTMVSNRLPAAPTGRGAERSSGEPAWAPGGARIGDYAARWIGRPATDVSVDPPLATDEPPLGRDRGSTPVHLPDALARDYDEGLSDSSIWPLLHAMPTHFRYRAQWWDAYRRVNRIFADRILASAGDRDAVWVHDYHLMLVPAMIKRARPGLRVGFFLHAPFPPPDVFRCHPNRDELLAGVLGADLVGFHAPAHVRNFRATVRNQLGIESDPAAVRRDGHTAALGAFPIGIDARRFEREMSSPAFAARCAAAATAYAGKRVVLSVERLDYTKGAPHRLDAVELFLARLTPAERDRVQFVFASLPARAGVDAYRDLRERVEHQVGRINGRYATLRNSPIHFLHRAVDFTDLCALYAAADVALVTPLTDGLGLVAREYVACQRDVPACAARRADRDGPGVLVLSEFAGAARDLPEALPVNPYDAPAVAGAIARALAMPADDRRRRMHPMRRRVFAHDADAWARDFLHKLASAGTRPPDEPEFGGEFGDLTDAVAG